MRTACRLTSLFKDHYQLTRKKYYILSIVLFIFTLFLIMLFEKYQSHAIAMSTLSKRLYSEFKQSNISSYTPIIKMLTVPTKCLQTNINSSISLPGELPDFAPHPHEFPMAVCDHPYNIENKNICNIGKNLTFVVLVHTATQHFTRRISMRNTWANKKLLQRNDIRIVFLLGKPGTESQQALIDLENSVYGDIVQGNFLDTYENLTHKAVLGIRWVVEHCLNTKVVLKIDDDVFVNIFHMISLSKTYFPRNSRRISCFLRRVLPINRIGKWKVDQEYFKNMTRYPCSACLGFFVVMTSDMFPDLYEAAKLTPFFWIDDIYFTGLLAKRIGGVTYEMAKYLNKDENQTMQCFEPKNDTCNYLTGGAHSEGKMDMIWHFYLRQYKEMATQYN